MSERQLVTAGIFTLTVLMLSMSWFRPELWEVETFKTLMQAVVITGLLNMVVAFHFTANRKDEQATENTGAAFRAIEETAKAASATAEPQKVEVVNPPDQPVPTTDAPADPNAGLPESLR